MTKTLDDMLADVRRRQDAGLLPRFPTRAQRISWAYGNAAVENPAVTREMAEKAADEDPRCCWCGHADPMGEKV